MPNFFLMCVHGSHSLWMCVCTYADPVITFVCSLLGRSWRRLSRWFGKNRWQWKIWWSKSSGMSLMLVGFYKIVLLWFKLHHLSSFGYHTFVDLTNAWSVCPSKSEINFALCSKCQILSSAICVDEKKACDRSGISLKSCRNWTAVSVIKFQFKLSLSTGPESW